MDVQESVERENVSIVREEISLNLSPVAKALLTKFMFVVCFSILGTI